MPWRIWISSKYLRLYETTQMQFSAAGEDGSSRVRGRFIDLQAVYTFHLSALPEKKSGRWKTRRRSSVA